LENVIQESVTEELKKDKNGMSWSVH